MDYTYFHTVILSILLASARMGGMMLILSPMTDSMIPGITRRAIILVFSVILIPKIQQTLPPEMLHLSFPVLFIAAKEVFIGVLIGFFANFPFWLSECIGNVIDNQRGSTMSEVFSPLSGTQVSTTGILMTQFTTVLFFVSGAWLLVLGAVYKSYDLWPVFDSFHGLASGTPQIVLGLGDSLMKNTLILSSPIIIVMFLATVGLGLVNRTAPQLNVFFLSMPIKSALGIFMMIIYLQYLMELLIYTSDESFLGPVRNLLN